MMDGRAGHGHGHGLARGGIFVEFLDGVSRPSSRSIADTHWPGFGRGGPVSKSAGGTADAAMRETSTAADVHNHGGRSPAKLPDVRSARVDDMRVRREALIDRVEVRDLHRRPVAAGR